MKEEIKIPTMGESISEATIGPIIKADGSLVKADDELLELETDKVTQVLYAPKGGVFHLNVKSDDVVTIGQVIGYIDTEEVSNQKSVEPVALAPAPTLPQPPAEGSARITKEAYIDDLTAKEKPKSMVASASQPTPELVRVEKRRETRKRMSKIRQVIARRLVDVLQETAMLTTFNEVDMSRVIELRNAHKDEFAKKHGVKLGFMSFFVKAVVAALKEYPEINSYIDGDQMVSRWYYDISIAVGTEKGVFVPVLRDCDQLSFAGIEKAILNYSSKAKEGTITPDDLKGGGFTITNGGVYGSLLSTPILNAPQSAILGMHTIQKRPVVVDDQIVIRPMMYLALSYDHRVVDGKEAVSFLLSIKNHLEDPSRFLFEV